MDNLFGLMKLYRCNYSTDKHFKKTVLKATSIQELVIFLQDETTCVDCGMATTGLVVLYLTSLVEIRSDILTIEQLLQDHQNSEENLYTIPTDGIVDKNMLLRILPKNSIENRRLKVRYFRTNYLQDKLLTLDTGFSSTSWGMWCLEIGTMEKTVPNELLFRDRDGYMEDTILYAFFNGKDERFRYNWVIGSKEDIETVTEEACIRDLEKTLVGYDPAKIRTRTDDNMIENIKKGILNSFFHIIKNNPKILDVTLQESFTHYIPNIFNLEILLHYLSNYATRLMYMASSHSNNSMESLRLIPTPESIRISRLGINLSKISDMGLAMDILEEIN